MSNFRDKAAAIKAEGVEKRGEFNPKGAPLRAYNYWLGETRSQKGRDIRNGKRKENFCHFWRVVAIWAPLMFLRRKAEAVIDSRWFGPVAGAILVGGFITFLLTTEGLISLFYLFLAIAGAVALLFAGAGVAYLCERFPAAAKKVGHTLGYLFIAAVVLFFVTLIVVEGGITGVVLLALGAAIGIVTWLNMENIADYIEGLRARNLRKRDERRDALSRQAREFFNENGYWPHEKVEREPGRVSKFFSGVGDFIIMLAQVIRVKKWGICPIVEIERETV